MRKATIAQRLAPLQTREEQATRQDGKIGARAARYAKGFFAVDGKIIAQHTPAKAKHSNIDSQQPSAGKEETVERQLVFIFNNSLFGQLQRACNSYGAACHNKGYPEQRLITIHSIVQPDAHRWRYGHCKIVTQAIQPNAFVSARGGQHINGAGAVGHRYSPKGGAMQRAANGKHKDGARSNIARKADKEGGETTHQHPFARKAVNHITAKGAHHQRRHSISAQHNAYRIFCGPKLLAKI